jgi:hypothetical protein
MLAVNISGVILSGPGALPFFSCLSACLTSSNDRGSDLILLAHSVDSGAPIL